MKSHPDFTLAMISDEAVPRCHNITAMVAVLCWLVFGAVGEAVPVDAELLLLVDVTGSVSDDEFETMMGAVAGGFESAGVVDAIQSGTLGSLAVSLVFYTHRNMQTVGVDWILISDANSAAAFALALESVERPFGQPPTGIAGAIDYGVPAFGDETGGAVNGYESEVQAMLFIGEGIDDHAQPTNGSRAQTVANSRDAALQSGVELIGAMTVGDAGTLDTYFEQYVVGGQVGDYPGAVTNVAEFDGLGAAMPPMLQGFVAAINPEPGWPALGLVALGLFGRRRRGRID